MTEQPSTSRAFSWEHGPFEPCPKCRTPDTFGILSIGGNSLRRRCAKCRFAHDQMLPKLDKKVIYLDQFAFSELHKLRAGTRREDKHTEFWGRTSELLNRALLLQQIVLPRSDVHHDETIVSPFPKELRETQDRIGGDIEFVATDEVQLAQVEAFASAFAAGTEPSILFAVDDVLESPRNEWLPDMRISVPWDWSTFAPETRVQRANSGSSVSSLIDRWIERGMDFDAVLMEELDAYPASRIEGLREAQRRFEARMAEGDLLATVDFVSGLAMRELQMVRHILSVSGIPPTDLTAKVHEFWRWRGNREQPFGKILAYLFAALADQFACGRKKKPTAGFMNDIRAISAYAPYVDAMFLDNECAQLLRYKRCRSALGLQSRIFSLNTNAEFLAYLEDLVAATPAAIRTQAEWLYGVPG